MKYFISLLILINTSFAFSQTQKADSVARSTIDGIYEKLMDGKSFSILAKLYSEDPGSAKQGGELEWAMRGTFVPEFEQVAFQLIDNEISKPFKTEFGYHIVQLIERRGDEFKFRHILIVPKLNY